MILVGPAEDLFYPHAEAALTVLYWADDCAHCYPDHAGNHEPHCRHAPGGAAG